MLNEKVQKPQLEGARARVKLSRTVQLLASLYHSIRSPGKRLIWQPLVKSLPVSEPQVVKLGKKVMQVRPMLLKSANISLSLARSRILQSKLISSLLSKTLDKSAS